MKTLILLLKTKISIAACAGSICLSASAQTGDALRAHRKAVDMIAESLQKLNGNSGVQSIKNLYVEWRGVKYMDGQSTDFAKPLDKLPSMTTILFDFEKDRLMAENEDRYLGGYLFHFRNVYGDSSAFSFEVPKYRFSGISDIPVTGKATQKQILLRNFPNYLLTVANEKKQTLRYTGQTEVNGKRAAVISFAYNQNLTVDVYIDTQSLLPLRYGYYTDHAIHGDQYIVTDYLNYKEQSGFLFPTKRKITANGTVMREDELTALRMNTVIDENLFARPTGYGKPVVMDKKLREIAKNIYLFEGLNGYNPLVVNFKDSLVVVEAVGGSEELLKTLQTNFPNKPIKTVIISHYHEDHSGGLISFVNRGIPVTATKGDVQYVEHFTSAKHAILADFTTKQAVKTIALTGNAEMKDENVNMQIIQAGPNLHANNMLMFYFPDAKILYQADMLISTDEGKISYPLIPVNAQLRELIKQKQLNVETIYGVHWKPIAFAELEKALGANAGK